MRIQKYLAKHSAFSRREIERMIVDKKIKINHAFAELGQLVSTNDIIHYAGKEHVVDCTLPSERSVMMINKPLGVICSNKDPDNRPSIYDLVPDDETWFAVGRLDINTSGLILFTTDGTFANQLMHPRYGVNRTYHVRIYGSNSLQTVKRLLDGVKIDGKMLRFRSCVPIKSSSTSKNHWFEVVTSTGQYRLVRRLWESCGCEVSRLIRVAYGPIKLPSSLKEGQTRLLSDNDIKQLERVIQHEDTGKS